MAEDTQAFVLRIAPGRIDRVAEALEDDDIIIGWSRAAELLDSSLDWDHFREVIRKNYYEGDDTLHRAGQAAGHLWRFLREMGPGDLVVVPHGAHFYVAKVEGVARHDSSRVADDTAFRRPVTWLNEKQPIPRAFARAALQTRMKVQGTTADAADLLDEIRESLRVAQGEATPTFESDLYTRLVQDTLDEIRSGRINDFGFESLLKSVLDAMGAENVRIVSRSQDKGADLLATFLLAGAFRLLVAVQAKHYQPEPPVSADAVHQLIQGIEAESADLGMVVTSGTISDDATRLAESYYEDKGIRIELVDGTQLAALIVEQGLRTP